MKKAQISLSALLLIVLAVGALTIGVNQVRVKGKPVDLGIQSLSRSLATAGCDYVGKTETLNDSFVCESDECDVYGTLTCDVSYGDSIVTARYDDDWLVINDDGVMKVYYYDNHIWGGGTREVVKCREMIGIVFPDNRKFIKYSSSGCDYFRCSYQGGVVTKAYGYKYDPLNTVGAITDSKPVNGYENQEIVEGTTGYTCTWNFCPSPDPNNEYCTKTESQTNSWTKSSSNAKYTLKKGQSVTFMPTDANGVPLASDKSMITSLNYDCTCVGECTVGDIKCDSRDIKHYYKSKSVTNGVPDAKTQCLNDGCAKCEDRGYEGSYWSRTYVFECTTYNRQYSYCMHSAPCNQWGPAIAYCDEGMVCASSPNGDGCVCDPNDCVLGEKECVSDTEYHVCEQYGKCTAFGNAKTCPNDKVPMQCKDGECVKVHECEFGEKQCVSDTTIKECKVDSNGVRYWSEPRECGTNQNEPSHCITDPVDGQDKCGCADEPCNSVTQKKCQGGDLYKCQQGSDGCYGWVLSDTGGCCMSDSDCLISQFCDHNKCKDKSSWCIDDSDCKSFEQCVSNQCECKTTGEFCSIGQLGLTRCADNTTIEVCKPDSVTGCYKWQYSETCSYPEICVQHSPARCEPPGELYTLNEKTYAANHIIEIPVIVKQSVGDIAGTQIRGNIKTQAGSSVASTNCILTKDFITGDYKCTLGFDGVSNKGSYILEVTTTLSGIDLKYTDSFDVYVGVGVNIDVKSILYTHEPAIAYVFVKDENGQPVPMCSQTTSAECFNRWIIDVEHNSQPVEINVVNTGTAGKVKVSFNVPSVGSVTIKAKTDGGQIVPEPVELAGIPVKAPTITIQEDIPSEVGYGRNRFEFKTYGPSNDPDVPNKLIDVPLSGIKVEVQPPNDAKFEPEVRKQGLGSYYFTIDMPKKAGQTYFMTITANYQDWPTQTTPDIQVIARSSTIDAPTGTDWGMIVIVVLVVLVLITLVLLRRRR